MRLTASVALILVGAALAACRTPADHTRSLSPTCSLACALPTYPLGLHCNPAQTAPLPLDSGLASNEECDRANWSTLPGWKQTRYKVEDLWFWTIRWSEFSGSNLGELTAICTDVPTQGYVLGNAAQDVWFSERNQSVSSICAAVRDNISGRDIDGWSAYVHAELSDPPCPGSIYGCPHNAPEYPGSDGTPVR